MAANCFKSLHHNHRSPPLRRHSIDCPAASSSFCPKLPSSQTTATATATSLSNYYSNLTAFSSSASPAAALSTTSPTAASATFDLLQQHLRSQNFREADEETRRLLIALAGEAAVKRGYVFFSEVKFIPESDLRAIDELWRKHSDGKFGYSVQKKVWNKVNKNFSTFFIKVGWMKKLDTEVEQYNYRAFPAEFRWENTDETPAGHLPLTNALRGTQLLNCILSHPAFESGEEEEDQFAAVKEEGRINNVTKGLPLSKGLMKTDYSF